MKETFEIVSCFLTCEDFDPPLLRLIYSKKIQDAVTAILGNTFYYQRSEIIIKDPQSPSLVPWKQCSG